MYTPRHVLPDSHRWLATREQHIRQPNGTMNGKARLFKMPEATFDRAAGIPQTGSGARLAVEQNEIVVHGLAHAPSR